MSPRSILFEYRRVTHWTIDRLWICVFVIYFARSKSYVIIELLLEPNPDAGFMELMFAWSCDDLFRLLHQSFLADTAVSLIGKLNSVSIVHKRLHQVLQCFFFRSSPLHYICLVASGSVASSLAISHCFSLVSICFIIWQVLSKPTAWYLTTFHAAATDTEHTNNEWNCWAYWAS